MIFRHIKIKLNNFIIKSYIFQWKKDSEEGKKNEKKKTSLGRRGRKRGNAKKTFTDILQIPLSEAFPRYAASGRTLVDY